MDSLCIGSKDPLGYGYIGARNNTTQQSGQTPDKEAEIKTLLFTSVATLKLMWLECYLPQLSGADKVSLFWVNSLVSDTCYSVHRIWVLLRQTKRI